MAINFPDTKNPNDTYTDGGRTWIWDGTTWKIYSSTTSGIGLANLSVTTASAGTSALSYNNGTGVFTYTPPDLSGYITSQYTLPTASTTVLGGVKVDGSTITINGSGVISGANTYSLPTASTTVLGGVKIDGTTITINNGVISGASSVPTSITVANEGADTTCFPLFTTAATGDLAPKTVTSLKLNSSSGQLEAGSFKKTGGTSSEFLKADGSIDSTTYLSSNPSYALNDLSNVDATTNLANGKILKYDLSTTSWILADDSGGSGSGGGNVAVGSVMMWSGSVATIPTGWQLCDGTNGSPDLRDKFVVGAGSTYAVDDTGGSKDAVVVEHKHTTSVDNHLLFDGSGSQNISYGGAGGYPAQTFTMNNEGVSGTDKNLPPYYALCYIYCTAAGSNQTFIGLSDTPISHSNGKYLQSNGSSLIWADGTSGGGGSSNFTGLSDTPSSLTAGKWLKVNAGGTALEYTDAPSTTETDTLATVTARGATTTTVLELSGGSGGTALHLKDGGDLRLWNAANTGNVELYCDNSNQLRINGEIEASSMIVGGLTYPTVNGTTGYVLTSNGSGTVSWQAQTGGGGRVYLLDDQSISSWGSTYTLTGIPTGGAGGTTPYKRITILFDGVAITNPGSGQVRIRLGTSNNGIDSSTYSSASTDGQGNTYTDSTGFIIGKTVSRGAAPLLSGSIVLDRSGGGGGGGSFGTIVQTHTIIEHDTTSTDHVYSGAGLKEFQADNFDRIEFSIDNSQTGGNNVNLTGSFFFGNVSVYVEF